MKRTSLFIGAALAGGFFFSFGAFAYADTVGQTVSFKVNSGYDARGASTASATLRAIGSRGYFYVDDRTWGSLPPSRQNQFVTALEQLATRFDQEIYPLQTALWGSEAKPGADNDERVTILLQNLNSTAGGYFESIHSYSASQAPGSNQRDMFFINADSVLAGTATGLIAHEFQHLISFNQKELLQQVSDDTWINEGRSEYGITESGYSQPYEGSALERRAQAFMRVPSDSLVEWLNVSTDYAITSLFAHYLVDRYGTSLLAYTGTAASAGVRAIDEWLSLNGKPESFEDIFGDWMAAVYLNDRSVGSQFGYIQAGLNAVRIQPAQTVWVDTSSASVTNVGLTEWQPYWLGLNVSIIGQLPSVLRMKVDASAGSWSGSYIATYTNGRRVVGKWKSSSGQSSVLVPTKRGEDILQSVVFAITQGPSIPVGSRQITTATATITAELGEFSAPQLEVRDGDLIRRPGESEIYVIWGKYRRYLTTDILKLYGFQDRPVTVVPDEVFHRYTTSNYVRALNGTKVYAIWPDGTKHWLNITPAQWDASGRDWGAIFVVNDAEVVYYGTGPDITR